MSTVVRLAAKLAVLTVVVYACLYHLDPFSLVLHDYFAILNA